MYIADLFGVSEEVLYDEYDNKLLLLNKKNIPDIKELIQDYLIDIIYFREGREWWYDCLVKVGENDCMISRNEALLMIYSIENLPSKFFSQKQSHRTNKIRLFTEILLTKEGFFFGFPFGLPEGHYKRDGKWLLSNDHEMFVCDLYTKTDYDYEGVISYLYFMNNEGRVSMVCYGNYLVPAANLRFVKPYLEAISQVKRVAHKEVDKFIIIPDCGTIGVDDSLRPEAIKSFADYMKESLETDIEIVIMDEQEIVKRLQESGIGHLYAKIECEDNL
jgi:hypothetical protein